MRRIAQIFAAILLCACPGGEHYTNFDARVGDDAIDAAVDAETPDAEVPDADLVDGAPGPCGARLVFRDGVAGQGEIYSANPDGSGITNLSNHVAEDTEPSWSPAVGGPIAFESNRDGNAEIYVVNANGAGLTNLTMNAAEDRRPRFSPDGTMIAFTRGTRLWVMNANGSNPRELATLTVPYYNAISWAPDNARIAVQAANDIQIIALAGGVTNVTNDGVGPPDYYPAWSPDGTLIAFMSEVSGNEEVNTFTPTGASQMNRTVNAAEDIQPAWSPNSLSIAFSTDRDGNAEIYTVALAGGVSRVTTHTGADREPVWSPDGTQIAFTRAIAGPQVDVVTINIDGTMEVTFSVSDVAGKVSWSPCLE